MGVHVLVVHAVCVCARVFGFAALWLRRFADNSRTHFVGGLHHHRARYGHMCHVLRRMRMKCERTDIIIMCGQLVVVNYICMCSYTDSVLTDFAVFVRALLSDMSSLPQIAFPRPAYAELSP